VTERVFLDTNIFVYADDSRAGRKRTLAQRLLAEVFENATAVVSTQVLQEFFAVATRKLGLPPDIVRAKVELIARLEVVQVDVDLILEAIDLHRLHALSFWDALVVCAAKSAKCSRLVTEDLQDGQVIMGIRIENPFA
jgi:predicted nucleic acid-binding protein